MADSVVDRGAVLHAPAVRAEPGASGRGAPIRMLVFARESFPTFRVDLEVLFGRELIGRGHEIDFVMQAGGADVQPGPRAWHGRTVWVGPTDGGEGFFHRLRRELLDVWHDLRRLSLATPDRYDAVQVRDKFLIAALAVWLVRRRGLRFFYWLSFPVPESQLAKARERSCRYPALAWVRGRVFGWLLYRWILPRSDHVFVQSRRMLEDVAAHGIPRGRMTPVPMGIADEDVRSDPRPSVRREGRELRLAYLGTLVAQRRLEILVEALAILRARGLAAKLELIGDGEIPEDRRRLERAAERLGVLPYLEITGFLARPRALERILAADVCLSPFHPTPVLLSTSPTKLVEYLALGRPVVANDHPEQRLVLRESRAGVCVPWGARHFARAVAWLARRSGAERLAMGERGRRWVLANRTYSRIADELESRYRAIFGALSARETPLSPDRDS